MKRDDKMFMCSKRAKVFKECSKTMPPVKSLYFDENGDIKDVEFWIDFDEWNYAVNGIKPKT